MKLTFNLLIILAALLDRIPHLFFTEQGVPVMVASIDSNIAYVVVAASVLGIIKLKVPARH